MIYVLDANVIIDYLRENESVKMHFSQAVIDGYTLIIPRAVDYEVRRGLELLAATKKETIYTELSNSSNRCKVVDMGEEIWAIAKQIYVALKRKSFTVGEIDILIGAFCLFHDYALITNNTKDFVNMGGIRLINWWASTNKTEQL